MGNIICGSIEKEYGFHDEEYRPKEVPEKAKKISQVKAKVGVNFGYHTVIKNYETPCFNKAT